MPRLSRSGGIPLYLQAVSAIRQLIQDGNLGKGSRLPSLEVMAERFGVARLTMRQAVKCLESEGVLESRRGLGITLVQNQPTPPRMKVYAALDDFMSLSRATVIRPLVQDMVAGCPICPDAPQDRQYRRWIRVHSDSGVPYGYLELYLDRRCYEMKPEEFDSRPTMHVFKEIPELMDGSFRQRLTVRAATAVEARHLGVTPGVPVANVLRVGMLQDGDIFFIAKVVYPGGQLQIDIEILPRGLGAEAVEHPE